MNPESYIKVRQRLWAQRQNINVTIKGYTSTLEENLFVNLSEATRAEFNGADGGELNSKNGKQPKMHAVHSSSALPVNVFEYWRQLRAASTSGEVLRPLAQACGLPATGLDQIRFEQKRPVCDYPRTKGFRKDPNLDIIFEYERGAIKEIGGESKFMEPYSAHKGIKPGYLALPELWHNIPHCAERAKMLGPTNSGLDVAQFLKHILGLKYRNGVGNFWLTYFWYPVPDIAVCEQFRQVEEFQQILKKDGIRFHAITYQEVVHNLSLAKLGPEHGPYLKYLMDRYL